MHFILFCSVWFSTAECSFHGAWMLCLQQAYDCRSRHQHGRTQQEQACLVAASLQPSWATSTSHHWLVPGHTTIVCMFAKPAPSAGGWSIFFFSAVRWLLKDTIVATILLAYWVLEVT